jgi:uncharacterized protein (UPF0297 family)
MKIPQQNNCSMGLRKSYIYANKGTHHYNIKTLSKIDKNLARSYVNAKYYGGSLKSFWKKVSRFGKKIFKSLKDSAINVTKNMYKPAKWIINGIAKNDTIKGLIKKGADALGATFGVPGLGNIVVKGITAANDITDTIENMIDSVMKKNPNMTKDEVKKLVEQAKETILDISQDANLSSEQKQKIKESISKIKPIDYINKLGEKITKGNVKDLGDKLDKVDLNKVQDKYMKLIEKIRKHNPSLSEKEVKGIVDNTIETAEKAKDKGLPVDDAQVKEILDAMPEVIKEEGYAKVKEAAGYLPFIDRTTITRTERTGKGGKILKPKIRVKKPLMISKHKDVFEGLPAYKAETVGEVAGRIFNSGRIGNGVKEDEKEGCGRMRLAGVPNPNATKTNGSSALQRLRARMGN